MAKTLTIDVDVDEVVELAQDTPIAEMRLIESIRDTLALTLSHLQSEVQAETEVGVTGNLRAGTRIDLGGIKPNYIGRVFYSALYGEAVVLGRPAGSKQPPIDAIELWVRRKLGITSNSRGVAFIIARAIAARGIKGTEVFDKVMDSESAAVAKIWRKWGIKAVKILDKALD